MKVRLFALLLLAAAILPAACGVAAADSGAGTITFVRSSNGHMEVFVMNKDFTNSVQVTNMGCACYCPSLSPDGTRIVFHARMNDRAGSSEIFSIQTDGTGLKQLTENRAYDGQPKWSPDGSRILYVSKVKNSAGEIYVMGVDGSNVTRLTDNHDVDMTPSWSPDGTKIVFARKPFAWPYCNVFVMNADGTGTKRLTSNLFDEANPVWSPDGARIAYCSIDRDGKKNTVAMLQGGIRVMNADGTRQERVKGTYHGDSHPSWSPDGSMIIFARATGLLNMELYVGYPGLEMDPNKLTNTLERECDPSWTW